MSGKKSSMIILSGSRGLGFPASGRISQMESPFRATGPSSLMSIASSLFGDMPGLGALPGNEPVYIEVDRGSGESTVCLTHEHLDLVKRLSKARSRLGDSKATEEWHRVLKQIIDGEVPELGSIQQPSVMDALKLSANKLHECAVEAISKLKQQKTAFMKGDSVVKANFTLTLNELEKFSKLSGDELVEAVVNRLATKTSFISDAVDEMRKSIFNEMRESVRDIESYEDIEDPGLNIISQQNNVDFLERRVKDALHIDELPADNDELLELVEPTRLTINEIREAVAEWAQAHSEIEAEAESAQENAPVVASAEPEPQAQATESAPQNVE